MVIFHLQPTKLRNRFAVVFRCTENVTRGLVVETNPTEKNINQPDKMKIALRSLCVITLMYTGVSVAWMLEPDNNAVAEIWKHASYSLPPIALLILSYYFKR